jgi:hypothetical protein
MERTQIFDLMSALKLFGMRTAYDDVMAAGIKRQHEPPQIVGDLLKAEITEKQARSIKYQMTIAKLPLAKDIDDFDFDGTTVNETLVRDLAGGGFVAQQRNVVIVGAPGPARRISPLPSREAASAPACAAASSIQSISSIAWRPTHAQGDRDESPITSLARTSPFSTNSAICPSLRLAGNCSSIS